MNNASEVTTMSPAAGVLPSMATEAPADNQTVRFLRAVWPAQGLYIVARLLEKTFRHTVCASIEDAAAYVKSFDSQGVPTYIACAAFREREVIKKRPDGSEWRQVRTHKNVRALKAWYIDLDVGIETERKFASKIEAIDALGDFCAKTELPVPLCVNSGGGIHCWWTLTREISPEQWKPVAETLKALCAHHGFKADPAVTADPARVLRPVGTWNRKSNPPRPVEFINEDDAKPVDFEEFRQLVVKAAEKVCLAVPDITSRESPPKDANADFAVKREYPPCSAHKIADQCQQMRIVRETRGRVSEPTWYGAIQLLCACIEGDALIHEWSQGDPRYSAELTNQKITQVRSQGLGPTLCTTFESRNPGGCEGCPKKGKISTPVQLGGLPLNIPVTTSASTAATASNTANVALPVAATNAAPESVVAKEGQPWFGTPLITRNPITEALEELNQQYAWVQKQKQIFRFQHKDFIEPAAFKIALLNRPPIQVTVGAKDPKSTPLATAWLQWPGRREHRDIVYEPGRPPIYNNQINLWPGWGCHPVEGDISLWRELLDEACGRGTPERVWFEQWAAFPIRNPGTKLFTAAMLWGAAQGLGKSLIGQTIGKLYGENYREIDNDALEKPFNAWAKAKQFVLGEELTSGDRRATMNRLKHLITGETICLDEKYQPEIVLRNTINFMFTSNNPDALHIDLNDRRICVIEFAGAKLPKEFFERFIKWRDIEGGLNALMHHLMSLSLDGFSPTTEAPMTRAKEEMMDATFTDIERFIFESLLDPKTAPYTEVVYAGDIARQFLGQKGQHVTETAVGRALARLGSRAKKRVSFPDGRRQLHAIRRPQYWAAVDERKWAEEYLRGQTVAVRFATTAPQVAPPRSQGSATV